MISKKTKIFKIYISEDTLSEVALNIIAEGLEAHLQSQIMSIDHIKSTAKLLKIEMKSHGIEIKHGNCLNICSRFFGYRDWNTAAALLRRLQKPADILKEGVV